MPDLIQAWLKGYRKVRALSKEEELEIPTFIMMRRLQLIAWIGSRENETTRELGVNTRSRRTLWQDNIWNIQKILLIFESH